MKKTQIIQNKHIVYTLLIGIIIFGFLGINSFGKRIEEESFLSSYFSNNWNLKNVPKTLKDERLLLQISKNIKNKKLETAQKYISGDTSENYFNRGTINLIKAYSLSKQNNLSGLQQARTLISQARNDLEIAKNIQLDTKLSKYIDKNINTAQGLGTIIETKTCYQEGGILLFEIKETITQTNKILEEQTKQLEKLKNLNIGSGNVCIVNLTNITNNNKIQIDNLRGDLLKKEQDYKNIIGEKLNYPAKCKGTSFEDTINKTRDAKESMIKYLLQQLEISQILDNPTPEGINQLCNGSKNDSQLNEKLSNSVSQMMKDLQKQSEKEKKKDQNGEPKNEQKDNPEKKGESENQKDSNQSKEGDKKGNEKEGKEGDKKSEKGNGESEYKDVLEQQERNLLNQTQQNSNKLIQQIQQIKGQGSYNGYQYIKNLFNSFMGNEGDLKNLHENKTEGTENNGSSQENNGSSQTQRY